MSKRSRATQFDDDDGDVKPRLQVPSDDEIEEEEEDEEMGLEDEEDDGGESEGDGPRSQPYFKKHKGLPEQEFGTLSLKELYRKIKRGEIRLDPKYQRGDVWSPARRSLLINSLFKNLHIPELLFNIHDTVDDDGSTTTVWDACDGKQRMTSIYKFMQGEFPVKDDTGTLYYYPTSHNLEARRLDATMKATFDKIKLRFGAYHDLNDAQETLLFNRVQGGMALSPSEVLKSNNGPWATWIGELCQRYFNTTPTSLSPRIARPLRAGEFTTLIYMARLYFNGLTSAKVLSTRQLTQIVTSDPLPSVGERQQFEAVLSRLHRLTLVKALPKDMASYPNSVKKAAAAGWKWPHRAWRQEPIRVVSPVELDFIPLLIARWPTLSDGDLLEVIHDFRSFAFDKYASERKRNSKVIGGLCDWIRRYRVGELRHKYLDNGARNPNVLPPKARVEDGAVPAPKSKAIASGPDASGSTSSNGTASASKNKRRIEISDESEEEVPLKKARSAASKSKSAGKGKGKERQSESETAGRKGKESGGDRASEKDRDGGKKKNSEPLTAEAEAREDELRREERRRRDAAFAPRTGTQELFRAPSTTPAPTARPEIYRHALAPPPPALSRTASFQSTSTSAAPSPPIYDQYPALPPPPPPPLPLPAYGRALPPPPARPSQPTSALPYGSVPGPSYGSVHHTTVDPRRRPTGH